MNKRTPYARLAALFLTVLLLFQPAMASVAALDLYGGSGGGVPAGTGEGLYADDDSVRVSIVLEDAPTVDAPYGIEGIAANADAMAYRHKLRQVQELVVRNIETYALDGNELDVVWNLTLIANVISANVEYGRIDAIKAMDGVADVFVEKRVYLDVMDASGTVAPAMTGSSAMSGSSLAHAAGFTGAGSRVAIIDTGIDTDHRSFDEGAFAYSLGLLEEKGLIRVDELDLMTAETIQGVLPELNIADKGIDVNRLYYSSKLPYAYNYAEPGADVNHHSGQAAKDMEHGSHVAGIAAANTYVPDNDRPGKYLYAAEEVGVCGMAPDAQILTLRVFDKTGGAYESTYMVAIEDAILLGADSINLSLGSAVSGFNRSNVYAGILENLVNSGTVCVASAGNNGSWADYGQLDGYILSEDVNFNTLGSPGSFSTTLSVGSVDNNNVRQPYFTVNGQWVFYHAVRTDAGALSAIAGEQPYVYLSDGAYADEDLRQIVGGKIAVCPRDGKTPLAAIARRAAEAGAIAVVLVNHEEGTLDPVLAGYHGGAPVVTVSKADGVLLKHAADTVQSGDGRAYSQGNMTVMPDLTEEKSDSYTMSFFSSFGVPGNLSLAPDIVAPGGNILSVNGYLPGGQAYVSFSGTSMAGPQVAGMSAVLAQYVRDLKLTETDRSARFLIQNLLMSTSVPFKDEENGYYYPVFRQGSGLADLDRALNAQAWILMDQEATPQYADGKVKAEFGDDRERTGVYSYAFTIENFSGKKNAYTLSTEVFTQALKKDQPLPNGKKADYLDQLAAHLDADVTYTVGDAAMRAGDSFPVEPYGSVTVRVEIRLTEEQKGILDDSYPNGAYVEGYTFIKGVADEEGVRDVEYSIPLIGFYGDWGDASMFDHADYVKRLYGDDALSYVYAYSTGHLWYANHFSIVDPVTDESRIYTGNPYTLEETFPEGRGAIRSTDTISGYSTVLIRSAAAAAVYLTNEEGEWIGMGNVRYQAEAASNYKGRWMTSTIVIPFSRTPASMNLHENDVFDVNVVAVPEYYETDGDISAEELRELIEGKKLGKGACLTAATLTVDDTAPTIISVTEDEEGILTVTAEDNQYIAYIGITDRSGTVVYGSCVPNGEKGGRVTCTFDLRDANVGPTCVVFVGDYAANSVTQYHLTNKTYPPLEGKLGGYVHEGNGDYNKAWTVLDPNDGGYRIAPIAYHGGDTVTAAAYVDGYLYQVIGSRLYTSPVEEIDYLTELVDLERFRLHSVYALSYNRADHLLYALTDGNTLWSIDPKNGYAESVTQLTVSGRTDGAGRIVSMAIDGEGRFYGITYYETGSSLLVEWTAEQLREGRSALTGVSLGETVRNRFGSMTYDAEKDALYLAEAYADNVSSSYNRLLCIDLKTKSVSHVTDSLRYAVRGLFWVPTADEDDTLDPAETIKELDILPEELRLFVTGWEDLSPLISPWTAENKELIWETSNEAAVTVKDGIVTAVGPGTATITVSSKANPSVKDACTVTVEDIPSMQLSALVYDTDKTGYFASYDVASPWELTEKIPLPGSYSFYAGGLSNGKLYVHDGYFLYTVDPETYAVEQMMMLTYLEFAWSDAAQVPKGAASFYEVAGLYVQDGSRFGTYSKTLRAPVSSALPVRSPAAAVAYIGDAAESATASCYYVLSEDGSLYRVTFPLPFQCEFLGVVPGVDLKGVSGITRGISASMWYDRDTELLVLSSRAKGQKATLRLIDPETLRVMSNTEFDDSVWYATALHQYAGAADKADTGAVSELREALAAESVQETAHSVYEGLEELLAAPTVRPQAAGAGVARVGNTTYPTLQAAVDAAHTLIQQGDHGAQTVTLLANVTESVRDVWIRSHIDYDYDLTIDLNGYTITGNGGPVLWFEAGGLGGAKYGYRITITDGSDGKTGAITGGTGKPDAFSKTHGGGVWFSGSTVNDSLTVSGGAVRGNSVTGNGGGIAMTGNAAAQLIINGGVITGNTAANGAVSGRWITVTGGEITGNHALGAGGGLCLLGTGTQELQVSGEARVYGNTAGGMGDDLAVISRRGGVTYRVALSDPSEWSENAGSGAAVAWYADGADGPYDPAGTVERFNGIDPQRLQAYSVSETGRNAPAYGVAAKQADGRAEEYTVTYTDGAGGTVFPEQTYPGLKAGTQTPPFNGGEAPVRQGYLFAGWEPAWSSVVTGDVTYVAQWTEIRAEGVTLDHTALSLREGESGTLTAAVSPENALNRTVQWSVEPNGVIALTYEGNLATLQAVGAGKATVTAEINGIKATCVVTVDHLWGTPAFDWQATADGYLLTAVRTCAMGHTQSAAAEASIQESTPPACTENGSITYTATVSFGGETFTQSKKVTVPATGHRYSDYRYDGNATYWADGTETAACDNHCGETDTRQAKGTRLTDDAAPTATVTVGSHSWSTFSAEIDFAVFFREAQDVTIRAEDVGAGVDKVAYLLSHAVLSMEELEAATSWTEYKTAFRLEPDDQWIVYVKVTDRVGNTGYSSGGGMVFDATAPVISGVVDGGTYYGPVTVTVREEHPDRVTVNGTPVELDEDDRFVLSGEDGVYTVIATDRAGNRSAVKVTLVAKAPERIEVTKLPDKTQYTEGESLDTAGMEVTVYYNDGTSEPVTGYAVACDLSSPGRKTVTVTYQGKTASFTVDVAAKPVKTALNELIEAAEALDENDYTSDTWAALAGALEKAKGVSADADATQAEIDAAAEALKAAIEALESARLLGDIDGNGKINSLDYMLLKRYVLGTYVFTGEQCAVADVNRDGRINATDYMLLKRHVLGTFTIG